MKHPTIPIGRALATLAEKLGEAGALALIRKELYVGCLTACAGQFHAVIDYRGSVDWPAEGQDRILPKAFWQYEWRQSGEWTIPIRTRTGERFGDIHMRADWQSGDFTFTLASYGTNAIVLKTSIVRAASVQVLEDGFSKLMGTLGMRAGKPEFEEVVEWMIDWLKSREGQPRGQKKAYEAFKDNPDFAGFRRKYFLDVYSEACGRLGIAMQKPVPSVRHAAP